MTHAVKKKADSDIKVKDLTMKGGGIGRKKQIRLKSLVEVRRFLAKVLNGLDAGEIDESKARTLGYLCSILKDVIRDSDLEQRIAKLEQGVKNDKRAG